MRVFIMIFMAMAIFFSNVSTSNGLISRDIHVAYNRHSEVDQIQEELERLVKEDVVFDPFYTGEELYCQLVEKLTEIAQRYEDDEQIPGIIIAIDDLPEEIWIELKKTIESEGRISMESVLNYHKASADKSYYFTLIP